LSIGRPATRCSVSYSRQCHAHQNSRDSPFLIVREALRGRVVLEQFPDSRRITDRELDAWLAPDSAYGRALAAELTTAELDRVHSAFRSQLVGKETSWSSAVAFLIARK
jgi:hypothetical protein